VEIAGRTSSLIVVATGTALDVAREERVSL
jgi:hypothetical protein